MSFQKAPLLELRFTEPVSHLCSEKRQHLVHIAKRLAMLTLRSLIFIMTLARQSPGAVSEDVLGAVSAGAVTWILTGNDLSVFQGEPWYLVGFFCPTKIIPSPSKNLEILLLVKDGCSEFFSTTRVGNLTTIWGGNPGTFCLRVGCYFLWLKKKDLWVTLISEDNFSNIHDNQSI